MVAALTIPTLIANQQKQEFAAKFEKTYSVLNQAFMKYAADQGCGNDLQCTGLFSDTVANNISKWDDFTENYLKVAKSCRTNTYSCFAYPYSFLNSSNPSTPTSSDTYAVVLTDGTVVGFGSGDAGNYNCTAYTSGYSTNDIFYGLCGFPSIDTNGRKGPNKLGVDYFAAGSVATTRYHGLVPFYGAKGVWESSSTNEWRNCETSVESYGYGCAARMQENGWVMDY